MNGRLPALVATSALAALTASTVAGPLRPQRVDADATWMIHIDVEQLMGSAMGTFLIEHSDDLELELDEVQQELGIDPREDLFSVTIYGDKHPEEEATVVLEMSEVVDEVLVALQKQDGYQQLEIEGHVVHRWEDGDPTFAHVIGAADPKRRIVVMGSTAARVVRAAEVVEGSRRSLRQVMSDPDGPVDESVLPRPGSIAYVFARGLPWIEPGDDPASTIARRSDRVRIELTEAEEITSVQMIISARTADDARNISDVLRGLVALASLLGDQEPELAPMESLSQHIEIGGHGNDVEVTLKARSDEMTQCLGQMVGLVD